MTTNFELLKITKMSSLKIYISSVMEKLETKFGQQVNLIQRILLGTPPQEVVTSLLYNHVILTNLFISSYRGAIVIKFGQYNKQHLDRSP